MKKISVKTFYLIGIISIGLIGLAIGSTYAMFTTSAEINNPIAINTVLGSENEIIETIDVKVPAGEIKTFTLTINNTSSSTLNYVTWYSTTSSNVLSGVKLSNADSSSPVGTISSGSSKVIYVQIKNQDSSSIDVTIGISSDANNVVLSSSMNQVNNEELYYILAEYLTVMYTNAEKTKVTNNSIEYNYATSVSLMTDQKGSSSTSIDSGNIRYYGASPNNYIYFNCSDYSNQSDSTCEKWRIIGLFDGKVKIMRNEIIGSYAWDNKNILTGALREHGKNDWSAARLMKLLNPGYESEKTGGSLYYNSGSGNCYSGKNNATTSCDFTSTGIKNDTTKNLISDTLYSLGGSTTYSIYSTQMYDYERGTTVYSGRPTSWTGKIGLAYPSDYGFAADFRNCTQDLDNYDNSECASYNWMEPIIAPNYGALITPYPDTSYTVWRININGGVGYDTAASTYGIVPVLYLNADTIIKTWEGTEDSPFQLKI